MSWFNTKINLLLLLVLVVVLIVLAAFNLDSYSIILFALGFLWNWGIYDEKIYDKIKINTRYRFSFLRFYSGYGNLILNIVKVENRLLSFAINLVAPSLIAVIFYALTKNMLVCMIPIGCLNFELLRLAIK